MVTQVVRLHLAFLIVASYALGQQGPTAAATPAQINEFPVIFQQNLVAGKTPVGDKIKAKLMVATFQNGTVIPRNAIFSGVVVESAAKTAADPARLEVRIDLAEWKNGSAPVKAYLTNLYYPTIEQGGQDLQYGPTRSDKSNWNGQGEYPDPNAKSYHPFPGSEPGKDSSVPDTPNSIPSSRRAVIKDVACEQLSDGSLVLTSKRSNLKLDHYTTYMLISGDLPAAK